MSMSTNIEDLPGPTPEEYDYENENQRQDNEDEYEYDDGRYEDFREDEVLDERQIPKEVFYEQPQKIKMNIRKRKTQKEEEDLFETIKKEVNEENLLIAIFLYLATTNIADEYTKKLLNMTSFNISSSFTLNIIKCVLLLVLFILVKHFVLPYFQL